MTALAAAPPAHAAYAAWDAERYLREYYLRVEPDEELTLAFLVREFRKIAAGATALEFGAGPTLHHLLPLAPHVSEMHVADYLPANLAAVRRWAQQRAGAHDWRPFTRYVLGREGHAQPNEPDVCQRENLTRSRLTRLFACDAMRPDPLMSAARRRYDVIVSCYCAESATADAAVWQRCMSHILGLLAPGGLFVTAALRKCARYRVGERWFPCAHIDERDVSAALLRAGFERGSTQVEVHAVPQLRTLGYESIVLASARAGAARPA